MFCKYCGEPIADDSLFCSKCGKSLQKEADHSEPGHIIQNEDNCFEDSSKKKDGSPKEWFYRDDFKKGGPVSFDQLKQMISNRQIDTDGEVRESDTDNWTHLTDSIFASVINDLPPKKVSISDIWVWCLAVLPMLIMVILQATQIVSFLKGYEWLVCILLNGIFLICDKKEIEKAEIHESWSYLGIIIVPLYLVIREVKTNHNYAPAIVNIFLLAIDFVLG